MASIDEITQAIDEGLRTMQRADTLIARCAYRLPGRLRQLGLDGDTLAALKRELRDFDMHQKRWLR